MVDEETKPRRKAKDNPWYRLATRHGEPAQPNDPNDMITTRNRESWNRWLASRMPSDLAEAWAMVGLRPFSEDEQHSIEAEVGTLEGDAIDFSNTDFDTPFTAAGFIFPRANFGGAIFSHNANFGRAIFSDSANFEGTIFSAGSGLSDFFFAQFGGYANFRHAKFGSSADFSNAKFSREADFRYAKFSSITFFRQTQFGGFAIFDEAQFSGYALFRRAAFGDRADFINAEMKGQTRFDNAKFSEPPKCFGAKLHEGTTWHRVVWPTPSDPAKAEEFADAYERLKLEMDRLKKHEAELDFFVLELKCKGRARGWKGLPIALYDYLCDCGRSYIRPLIIFLVLGILGAVPIRAHFGGSWSFATFTEYPTGRALGLSFANMFGFLSLRKDLIDPVLLQGLPGCLKVIAALQTIFGIVLIFLFSLSIRNRFRMK